MACSGVAPLKFLDSRNMSAELLHYVFGGDTSLWNKGEVKDFCEMHAKIFEVEQSFNKNADNPMRLLLTAKQEEIIEWICKSGYYSINFTNAETLLGQAIAEFRTTMRREHSRRCTVLGKFMWKSDLYDALDIAIGNAKSMLEPLANYQDLNEKLNERIEREKGWLILINDFKRCAFIHQIEIEIGDDFRDFLARNYDKLVKNLYEIQDHSFYNQDKMQKCIDEMMTTLTNKFEQNFPLIIPGDDGEGSEHNQIMTSKKYLLEALDLVGRCIKVKNDYNQKICVHHLENIIDKFYKDILNSKTKIIKHQLNGTIAIKGYIQRKKLKYLGEITKYCEAVAIEDENDFREQFIFKLNSKKEELVSKIGDEYQTQLPPLLQKMRTTILNETAQQRAEDSSLESLVAEELRKASVRAMTKRLDEIEHTYTTEKVASAQELANISGDNESPCYDEISTENCTSSRSSSSNHEGAPPVARVDLHVSTTTQRNGEKRRSSSGDDTSISNGIRGSSNNKRSRVSQNP